MEKIIHTDIFIAGAGASGIAAAVASAEAGLTVCIAEKNSYAGGRATASAVGTICGLFLRSYDAPEFAMHGFPRKFAAQLVEISGKQAAKFGEGLWFLPCHPDDFEKAAAVFLAHEKITVLYDTMVESVFSSRGVITEIFCSGRNENLKIIPKCVVDCSGEGIVCKSVNHEIISDREYQAAAIVFSVNNLSAADEFQLSFSLLKKITEQVGSGNAPGYFSLLSIVPYSLRNNSVLMKMGLPWKADEYTPALMLKRAGELVHEMFSFIKSNVTGFNASEIEWIAKEVGVRTGIRARGRKILTDKDVLTCMKTPDSICNGAWPVEYWRTGNKRVEMTYLPEKDFYSIPAGCLESAETENLFFAGKIISAEEKAIASARVIGTCFGTGYAAGILAAYKAGNKSRHDAIDFIRQNMLSIK